MQTYSERRQAILFAASRQMRKLAGEVLDDVQLEAEITGNTAAWAKSKAASIACQANQLEDAGHEQCIASARSENALYVSRNAYSQAIDRFEMRLRQYGVDPRSITIDRPAVTRLEKAAEAALEDQS